MNDRSFCPRVYVFWRIVHVRQRLKDFTIVCRQPAAHNPPAIDSTRSSGPSLKAVCSPQLDRRKCMLESLERRRLLSSAILKNGILTIVGGAGNDTILLAKSGSNISVSIDGVASGPFKSSSVTGISIDAGSGNDSVSLLSNGEANAVTQPATILGGKGNDTLAGGTGADSLDGGAGTDTADYSSRSEQLYLFATGIANCGAYNLAKNQSIEGDSINANVENLIGGSDADFIYGTPGNNLLAGGGGNDLIYGESGSDTIDGGDGNDSLNGGSNNDSITGGAGNDAISGDARVIQGGKPVNDTTFVPGNDTLDGGAGDDTLLGGGDQLDSHSADDSLMGDAGNDFL